MTCTLAASEAAKHQAASLRDTPASIARATKLPFPAGSGSPTEANSVGSHNTGPNQALNTASQSSHSTASDFLDGLAPFPKTTNAKFFEYAPKGKQSGYCVSEPWRHSGLVLRQCNGSANQAWDATLNGPFEWKNEATGDVMTDPGKNGSAGKAGTQLTGANATGSANQLWDAVDS